MRMNIRQSGCACLAAKYWRMAGVCAEMSFTTIGAAICCSVSGVAWFAKMVRRKARISQMRSAEELFAVEGLEEEDQSGKDQSGADHSEEERSLQPAICDASKQHARQRRWKGEQVEMRHRRRPKAGDAIASHNQDAGGKEITLQRGPEMLRRPTSHGAVDDKWRTVHSIGAA